jgi:hypothetical protein
VDAIAQLAQLLADNPEWIGIVATGVVAGVRRWRVRPQDVTLRANEVHIHVDGGEIVLTTEQVERVEVTA